ncbi:DUF4381 domain-containing protein [Roseomonas terrae]|uniref:DUF4381 domain-containing protein n=1 Tax=Neoroseomonas terrae TaxID=424799 RepID=A0ABS5EMC5_9PROT|nr:DUF4381 domain-containing protein [Neoroseomonas terrae]MBR0651777.1 DUF4381 domain-containing protein [Neoroseomonas terrae]
MTADTPTREAMHGLILPPPVAFWPATPAWYAVYGIVAALLAWCGWLAWRRWRANAYRREALRAVAGAAPAEIAAILKRAALAAWPRAQVAGLAGADWAAFLRRTAPRAGLDAAAAERLAMLAYAPAGPSARSDAERWIRFHDPRL